MGALVLPLPTGLDPRTTAAFEEILAALQTWAGKVNNQHQIGGYLSAIQPRCHLIKGATQTIANNTLTDLTWPVIGQEKPEAGAAAFETNYDNSARFGPTFLRVAAGTGLTPPIPGMYLVIATVVWTPNATGSRLTKIRQDFGGTAVTYGAGVAQQPGGHSGTVETVQQAIAVLRFRDVAQTGQLDRAFVQVSQTSGGDLTVTADCHIAMIKVS